MLTIFISQYLGKTTNKQKFDQGHQEAHLRISSGLTGGVETVRAHWEVAGALAACSLIIAAKKQAFLEVQVYGTFWQETRERAAQWSHFRQQRNGGGGGALLSVVAEWWSAGVQVCGRLGSGGGSGLDGAGWVLVMGWEGCTQAILVPGSFGDRESWLLLRRTIQGGASLHSFGFTRLRNFGIDLTAYQGELFLDALEQGFLFLVVVLPRFQKMYFVKVSEVPSLGPASSDAARVVVYCSQ